jgi:hypothetical protein
MKVVKNTVEDVRFIITAMVCSVQVAVWCHQLIDGIKKG